MRKRIIILAIIDFILISLWAYWAEVIEPTQGEAMGLILLIPALILVSGIVALFLLARKSTWGDPLLMNVAIAFAIYFGIFKFMDWRDDRNHFKRYYFTYHNETYTISLNLNNGRLQDSAEYSFYIRLGDYGSQGTNLGGTYSLQNDTVTLTTHEGKKMKIFKKALYDYPQKDSVKTLRNNP